MGNLQMGSTMKQSIFDEQTSRALRQWHKKAKHKKNEMKPEHVSTRTLGGSPTGSPEASPLTNAKLRAKSSEMNDVEADTTAAIQMANITMSVHNGDNKQQCGQPDLLTGP